MTVLGLRHEQLTIEAQKVTLLRHEHVAYNDTWSYTALHRGTLTLTLLNYISIE